MIKKVAAVIAIVVFLILSIGTITGVTVMSLEHYTEQNTTEFSATVKEIDIQDSGDSAYCTIYTEEYGGRLNTLPLKKVCEPNDFIDIQKGDKIFFRLQNSLVNNIESINEFMWFPVVSIRTANRTIVSLEDYNENLTGLSPAATIGSIAVSLALLLAAIYLIVRLWRARKLKSCGSKVQ